MCWCFRIGDATGRLGNGYLQIAMAELQASGWLVKLDLKMGK